MRDFFSATLKRTVMLVVLLAVLPSLGIIIASGIQRYNESYDNILRRGLRTVQSIVERQRLATENTHTLLTSLSQVAAVQSFDTHTTSLLFKKITAEYPAFANIFLTAPSGEVLSSGLPVPPGLSFADTPFIKGADPDTGFRAVAATVSPFARVPVMLFAQPLYDRRGTFRGYLGAELHLRFFDRIFAGQNIPSKSIIYVLDGAGALVTTSTPSAPVQLGELMSGPLWTAVEKTPDGKGTVTYTNASGAQYFATYQKITMGQKGKPYLHVILATPRNEAYALPTRLLQRDIALLAAAALCALIAGLLFCFRGVVIPSRKLLAAARQVSSGNLGAKIGPDAQLYGEFAQLADEFNVMTTALEQRNSELVKARDTAAASSKAKSEFLANMSHEIRTPMNAILGMAYLVLKTELSAPQHAYVTKILGAANTLLRIINDILDFSKIEAGKLNMENIPFRLSRILGAVKAEAAERAGARKINFTGSIAPDVPPQVMGDPLRLSQALSILLNEAISHSENTVIELGCAVESRTEEAVVLHFLIGTHGSTLPEKDLQTMRRWLSGSSTSSSDRLDGTALSLTLCQRIIKLLDGHITVENSGSGSFRLVASAHLAIASSLPDQQPLLFDGERVLVVDENSASREALMDTLKKYNLRVMGCPGIREAALHLRAADGKGVPFNLLFMDIPPASSEAPLHVERIKHGLNLTHPPLIILSTARAMSEAPSSLYRAGLDAFLPKPVSESLLVDMLTGLMHGRAVPQAIAAPRGTAAGEALPFAGLRVLLVEDNAVNEQIARELLEEKGITVTSAANGLEAVAACAHNPPPFDLVLMDLQMPGMDGYTATRVLRGTNNLNKWQLPIIAMTAHTGVDEVAACLEAGMNGHTVKPIMVDQLFSTIRRWLPVSPSAAQAALGPLERLRGFAARGEWQDAAQSSLLAELAPLLHPGRAEALRAFFAKQDSQAVLGLLDGLLEQFS